MEAEDSSVYSFSFTAAFAAHGVSSNLNYKEADYSTQRVY